MKCIDADKLKAEIERLEVLYDEALKNPSFASYESSLIAKGKHRQREDLLSFIDSLQQEQESVAERFARIVRGNLIGIDKEVQQKFEHLYFEVTGNKMYGGYND